MREKERMLEHVRHGEHVIVPKRRRGLQGILRPCDVHCGRIRKCKARRRGKGPGQARIAARGGVAEGALRWTREVGA